MQEIINDIDGPAREKISHPIRLLIGGRSTLGKTTLAVDIMIKQLMRDVNRCYAVCPTFWTQKACEPLRNIPGAFNESNVFTQVTDEIFAYIYQQCLQKICLQHGPQCASGKCVKSQIPTLLFVDDAASEHATNKGNKGAFSGLCIASPHLNLSIVGCFQRLTSASPSFRDNCEALISFIPSKTHDVELIMEEFNATPSHPESRRIIRRMLTDVWNRSRFIFILRERFTGKTHYYCGFNDKVELINV